MATYGCAHAFLDDVPYLGGFSSTPFSASFHISHHLGTQRYHYLHTPPHILMFHSCSVSTSVGLFRYPSVWLRITIRLASLSQGYSDFNTNNIKTLQQSNWDAFFLLPFVYVVERQPAVISDTLSEVPPGLSPDLWRQLTNSSDDGSCLLSRESFASRCRMHQ